MSFEAKEWSLGERVHPEDLTRIERGVGDTQTAAENAQTAANNAQTAAENAQTAAEAAQNSGGFSPTALAAQAVLGNGTGRTIRNTTSRPSTVPANSTDLITQTTLNNAALHASAIVAGDVAIARLPTGTTAQTVALGNHTHSSSQIAGAAFPNAGTTAALGGGNVGLTWHFFNDLTQGQADSAIRQSGVRRIGNVVELVILLNRAETGPSTSILLNYTLQTGFRPPAYIVFPMEEMFSGRPANAQLNVDHRGRLQINFGTNTATGSIMVVATYFATGSVSGEATPDITREDLGIVGPLNASPHTYSMQIGNYRIFSGTYRGVAVNGDNDFNGGWATVTYPLPFISTPNLSTNVANWLNRWAICGTRNPSATGFQGAQTWTNNALSTGTELVQWRASGFISEGVAMPSMSAMYISVDNDGYLYEVVTGAFSTDKIECECFEFEHPINAYKYVDNKIILDVEKAQTLEVEYKLMLKMMQKHHNLVNNQVETINNLVKRLEFLEKGSEKNA